MKQGSRFIHHPVLFYDSAGSKTLVALKTAQQLYVAPERDKMDAAQYLVYDIVQLCAQAHIIMKDLRAVITTQGPGSFTGLRLGLSAAHGWRFISQTSIFFVNRLDLYGHTIMQKFCLTACVILLEADQNRTYFQGVYRSSSSINYAWLAETHIMKKNQDLPWFISQNKHKPPTYVQEVPLEIASLVGGAIQLAQPLKTYTQPFYLKPAYCSLFQPSL